MTQTRENRRGWATAPAPSTCKVTDNFTHDHNGSADVAGLRRRRAAARRMPPLRCGYVDPLDHLAVAPSPCSSDAARRAWYHLQALGYVSEDTARVLAEGVVA